MEDIDDSPAGAGRAIERTWQDLQAAESDIMDEEEDDTESADLDLDETDPDMIDDRDSDDRSEDAVFDRGALGIDPEISDHRQPRIDYPDSMDRSRPDAGPDDY